MILESHSPEETQKIASDLANKIINSREGVVIALEGDLGAGKTTFIQGFAKALGITEKVKRPTFVLMKKYPIPTDNHNPKTINFLYHLDCYRVEDHKDLRIPEIEEILNMPNNIVLIEWAERIKNILPQKHIQINIDHVDQNNRRIEILEIK